MLNAFRDSLKHGTWPKLVLAAVAVGLVAYLGAYFSCDAGARKTSAYAAVVNGEQISVRTFQLTARRIDQNYRRLFGENYEQLKAQMRIGTQAIQSLVEERLILQDAARLGLVVTASERDKAVREILTDPSTGEYVGKQRGEQLVRQNYGNVSDFMSLVDNDLVMRKWSDLVTATASVSEDELIEAFSQRNEKTAVDFVVVPAAEQEVAEASLNDDAVARWYEEHQDDYFREEGRKIRFVVVERQAQLERVEVSEEEVRASYEANRASYSHPEQRRAMHILFRVAPDTSDEERERLRGVAESVRERVLAGEDFAELAAAYSQDPGSAQRGGDLGFFNRGDMVGPFDAAAFETPVGEVAPVVETDFGFHVIKVTDERPEGVTPLEDVAEEIRRNLQLRKAQDRVLAEAERLRTELEAGTELDALAQAEGIEVQSRVVIRGERPADLGAAPEFMDTVFGLEPGQISRPLRVARGMALVVVDESIDAAVAPLDEIADRVRGDLRKELSRQAALDAAQQALDRGGEFTAIARRLDKEVTASGDLAPGQGLPGAGGATSELRERLFAPGLMEGDRGVIEVPAGALVFEVTRREPFDSYAFEDEKATLRQELMEQKKSALRQSILQQMQRVQDVEINGALIESYDS